MPTPTRYMTTSQAAQMLGVSGVTLRDQINQGKIPRECWTRTGGGHLRIDARKFIEWADSRDLDSGPPEQILRIALLNKLQAIEHAVHGMTDFDLLNTAYGDVLTLEQSLAEPSVGA